MAYVSASLRGWGAGWPTGVTSSQLVQVDIGGTRFPGGVQAEIAPLVTLLVAECKRRGYVFGVPGDPAYGCWGYANRPIGGTQTPSNHSWGLAVDINAPRNPQRSPLTTDMPPWLPALWKAYGFRWGGDYTAATPDPMHFEFTGTPADAATFTAAARAAFTPGTSEENDMTPEESARLTRILAAVDNISWGVLSDQGLRVAVADIQAKLATGQGGSVDAAAVAAKLAADPAFLAGIAKAVNDDAAARMKN